MALDFELIFDKLKEDVSNLAKETAKKYADDAKTDALAAVDGLKDNLKTWTIQLKDGKLSKADYEFLVLAQKELVEMNALKQAGLALIKADEFKNKLMDQIISTVTSFI